MPPVCLVLHPVLTSHHSCFVLHPAESAFSRRVEGKVQNNFEETNSNSQNSSGKCGHPFVPLPCSSPSRIQLSSVNVGVLWGVLFKLPGSQPSWGSALFSLLSRFLALQPCQTGDVEILLPRTKYSSIDFSEGSQDTEKGWMEIRQYLCCVCVSVQSWWSKGICKQQSLRTVDRTAVCRLQ